MAAGRAHSAGRGLSPLHCLPTAGVQGRGAVAVEEGEASGGCNGTNGLPLSPSPLTGPDMVRLHVKRADESQFLLEAAGSTRLADLAPLVARIYNGRLKVQRLCSGTGPPGPCPRQPAGAGFYPRAGVGSLPGRAGPHFGRVRSAEAAGQAAFIARSPE